MRCCFDTALLNNVNVQCVLQAEEGKGEKGWRRCVKKELNGGVCVIFLPLVADGRRAGGLK